MPDLGLTHVALSVRDLDASISFYAKYAGMAVVHRRAHDGVRSVWLTDRTRPFVIVLATMSGSRGKWRCRRIAPRFKRRREPRRRFRRMPEPNSEDRCSRGCRL
jgi:catechol 2,3-dioxygenase-like lactoylglutathione lyase family enzyme